MYNKIYHKYICIKKNPYKPKDIWVIYSQQQIKLNIIIYQFTVFHVRGHCIITYAKIGRFLPTHPPCNA